MEAKKFVNWLRGLYKLASFLIFRPRAAWAFLMLTFLAPKSARLADAGEYEAAARETERVLRYVEFLVERYGSNFGFLDIFSAQLESCYRNLGNQESARLARSRHEAILMNKVHRIQKTE